MDSLSALHAPGSTAAPSVAAPSAAAAASASAAAAASAATSSSATATTISGVAAKMAGKTIAASAMRITNPTSAAIAIAIVLKQSDTDPQLSAYTGDVVSNKKPAAHPIASTNILNHFLRMSISFVMVTVQKRDDVDIGAGGCGGT